MSQVKRKDFDFTDFQPKRLRLEPLPLQSDNSIDEDSQRASECLGLNKTDIQVLTSASPIVNHHKTLEARLNDLEALVDQVQKSALELKASLDQQRKFTLEREANLEANLQAKIDAERKARLEWELN